MSDIFIFEDDIIEDESLILYKSLPKQMPDTDFNRGVSKSTSGESNGL